MPQEPATLSADLAALRDVLRSLDFSDAQGSSAEHIRATLAGRGLQMSMIADVAEAVAAAVDQRAALVAQRDAAMPSEADIKAAEDAVVAAAAAAAAGEGSADDVTVASNRLADLLAQKRAAEQTYQDGTTSAAQTLDQAASPLPDPGQVLPVLGSLAGILSGLAAPAQEAFSGTPTAAPAQTVPETTTAQPATTGLSDNELIDALMPTPDGNAATAYEPVIGDPRADRPGMTHTSADLSSAAPALTGVHTSADVSGRPANPFLSAPASTSASPSGVSPSMGAPMMPMAPMAGGQGTDPGVASPAKKKTGPTIDTKDPDMTGDDISAGIATSGVIGRGEAPRLPGGGERP